MTRARRAGFVVLGLTLTLLSHAACADAQVVAKVGGEESPNGTVRERESILFVACHSDDTEGFAATAKLLSKNYDIHVVDVCHGVYELGEKGIRDDPRVPKRMKDEYVACDYMGFTPHFLSEQDADACASDRSATQLTEIIRKVRPRAVFTHWPLDRHADHVQCAALVARALVRAGRAPGPGVKWNATMCERYFFEVMIGQTQNFHPTYSVDVSETIEDKLQMMRRYGSKDVGEGIAWDNRNRAALRGSERTPKCAACELFATLVGTPIKGGIFDGMKEAVLSRPGEGGRKTSPDGRY